MTTSPSSSEAIAEIRAFMQAARRMEDKRNLENALELYRQALELAQADPTLRSLAPEIELIIQDAERRTTAAAQATSLRSPAPLTASPQSPLSLVEAGQGTGRAEPRRKLGWGFWLLWVLVSAVGSAVGSAMNEAVVRAVGWGVSHAVSWAVGGAAVGIAQWLVLRHQVRRAGWWILASALGWAVGQGTSQDVLSAMLEAVGWARIGAVVGAVFLAVSWAVGGAVVGVAQWLVLRRQVRRAGWWILASALGWAMGLVTAISQGWAMGLVTAISQGMATTYMVRSIIFGAVGGAITGAALVWLLHQPRSVEQQ